MIQDFFKPELPENTVYHVGISGGKDSGAVLLWLVYESGIPRHKINATFCDTGNEHEWTYEQVRLLSEKVHPIETIRPELTFYKLAERKQRFPSSQARFCTYELKIKPSQDHIAYLSQSYDAVVNVTGVRASESFERSSYLEWDYNGYLLVPSWRPLLQWSIKDVYSIHAKYNMPLNPLYSNGAERVGCFPCIMSKKHEIRNIAQRFPKRIEILSHWERKLDSSFFGPSKTPARFHSGSCVNRDGNTVTFPYIEDVVKWSMTGKRAKGSWEDDPPEPISCSSGFCE